ncbi:hypothetical protein HIM_05184 [Hirsutella minnesotensis 3608]|uniref:Uncharacterized protein n=1 Tax=Hirsutella minnesotensis 3608 TaxID=1043627 RepID=A0A0F7ZUU8_9HYPO|nr:hypothetical protein HIM_05184 [Hirsutella minnesotensis 3608]
MDQNPVSKDITMATGLDEKAPQPIFKLFRTSCHCSSGPRWSTFAGTNEATEADEWITDSITINCLAIHHIFTGLLRKYKDFDLEFKEWTFALDDDTRVAAQNLIDLAHPLTKQAVKEIAEIHRTGKVDFASIWSIFPAWPLVKATSFGHDVVCRVLLIRPPG